MAGRPRKPIEMQESSRRVHRSKDYKEERQSQEISTEDIDIECPSYITDTDSRLEFVRYATLLKNIGQWNELLTDTLGRYINAQKAYEEATIRINKAWETPLSDDMEERDRDDKSLEIAQRIQDKAFSQADKCAKELAMTVDGQCKLIVARQENDDGGYNL